MESTVKLKYKLDKQEQWLEDHADEFVPVTGAERRRIDRDLAIMRKKKAITLRINVNDLGKIKEKAERDGLPYQTLISSVLHKFADNRLCEKVEPAEYGRKRA
jgi:predicted DNA binding CopG/RHH family protein